MKNLISFSFLLILLPQLSFIQWQNKLLTLDNKFKPQFIINTPQKFTPDKIEKKVNNNYPTNLIAQNQSIPAESDKLSGTATNMRSTDDRMVSYRHQRHLWVTSDGAIHVLFNQGTNYYGASLVLYSSFDSGKSWKWILSIPNTDSTSTADGFLSNQKIFLTYSSATGRILFLPITYDSLAKKWIVAPETNVYQSNDFIATNPTIAVDSNGYLWTTFVAQQTFSKNYSIRLFNSPNRGLSWANTYVNLGAINQSARKSARLVALKDRIGIIFTNDDTFYWAYKINNSTFPTPWQTQSIFTYQPSSNNSLYSSHFSLVSDPFDNIHLVTHDLGRLVYLKFDSRKQTWQPIKILSDDARVSYTQVSLSTRNKLLITYNRLTQVGVFESSNYGESFKFINLLAHPQESDVRGTIVNFEAPRIITPAIISNKLPLLQQFQIDGAYGLINFNLKLEAQPSQISAN